MHAFSSEVSVALRVGLSAGLRFFAVLGVCLGFLLLLSVYILLAGGEGCGCEMQFPLIQQEPFFLLALSLRCLKLGWLAIS